MNDKNKGNETEKLIGTIAETVVLRDFVVRNPKFKKPNGNGEEKELTDILIPFGEDVISIQAKSKVINTASPADVVEKRIQKIIDHAVGQLANTRKMVDVGEVLFYENTHGIKVPLDSPNVKTIHGLVLVNIYDQDDAHVRIENSFVYRHNMGVHILDVADFYAISSEIDTIPDLIDYLSARTKLFIDSKISPGTNELDLLATYKTQPEIITKVLEDKHGHIVILPGAWDEYQSISGEAIKKRNELNRASYLIDMTINEMSKSIGYSPVEKNPVTGETMMPGTVEGYWAVISELSKMKRLNRRIFGEKMKEKMEKANDPKYREGYSVLLTKPDEAILFYSTDLDDRKERLSRLAVLAGTAYAAKNLRQIVAIATEPMSGHGRSFDVIAYKDVDVKNKAELKEQAKRMFDEGKHYEGYEYEGE